MKKIIMALAVTAFAYAGAEAQVNCTVVPKKVTVRTQQVNTCKLVPLDVCKISPDRRSVTCYKTVDEKNLTPYGTQTSYYGPTGRVPGEKAKFETQTVIIKGANNKDYCTRDEATKTTTCYHSGYRVCRDADGYYSYCPDPATNANYTHKKDRAKIRTGNTGLVAR